MSHLFLARVHPPNNMRMFQLVSLNLRWLRHNPWKNLFVWPNFTFFTHPSFSSPFHQPSSAFPNPLHSVIIIDDMPVRSPLPFLLPLVFPLPPTASSTHSHDEACQEFSDL
ncbi:hypothetical protein O181_015918 [Austropuccinia psidii MF-1]|uniref:Uncharacterized protein n=1 Tax=Austropuccinia psidii MF-1 TaxID=1389203 RepID=A0A9Q3C449_9BASI|nr:hypothetical protein [Austropuccinia psidii MF-1]